MMAATLPPACNSTAAEIGERPAKKFCSHALNRPPKKSGLGTFRRPRAGGSTSAGSQEKRHMASSTRASPDAGANPCQTGVAVPVGQKTLSGELTIAERCTVAQPAGYQGFYDAFKEWVEVNRRSMEMPALDRTLADYLDVMMPNNQRAGQREKLRTAVVYFITDLSVAMLPRAGRPGSHYHNIAA